MTPADFDPAAIIGLSGVPFIAALVEGTKRTFPCLQPRWYVLVSILWALALNVLLAPLVGYPLQHAIVVALSTGLAASGLYSAVKHASMPSPKVERTLNAPYTKDTP